MALSSTELQNLVIDALEDKKGSDIVCIDVTKLTDVTDAMIICSANSNRQARALAENVIQRAKQAGITPIGIEGVDQGEWSLIDLGDALVHIMLPSIREHYNLEKLWTMADISSGQQNTG